MIDMLVGDHGSPAIYRFEPGNLNNRIFYEISPKTGETICIVDLREVLKAVYISGVHITEHSVTPIELNGTKYVMDIKDLDKLENIRV